MKIGWVAAPLLLLLMGWVLAGPPSTSQTVPGAEDLFKWGEYDSLIHVLEPILKAQPDDQGLTAGDSEVKAMQALYLGVAYYATGKRILADEAFLRAKRLKPSIKLDRFYVTAEMADYFEDLKPTVPSTANEHGRNPKPNPDSTPKSQGNPSKGEGTKIASSPGMPGWIWFGLGTAAVIGAAGGAYLMMHHPVAPEESVTVITVK